MKKHIQPSMLLTNELTAFNTITLHYEMDRNSISIYSPRVFVSNYYKCMLLQTAMQAPFRSSSHSINCYSSVRLTALSTRYNSDGIYSTIAPSVNVSVRQSSRKESLDGMNNEGVYYASGHYLRNATDYQHDAQNISHRYPGKNQRCYDQESFSPSRSRCASQNIPQHPTTARPVATPYEAPPVQRKAVEADAKKYGIPTGYSLKNWDPTEEPILFLGSVFDANSLGKWIYDWTVYSKGSSAPISKEAGELWLLLIQLAGKVKRAKEIAPRVRVHGNRDMVEDFIESSERLTDKLWDLIKSCKKPMLKASKRKDGQLGQGSGIEFVNTMFGRERKLEKTEQFMQSVRLWNLRFDTNCEDILKDPEY